MIRNCKAFFCILRAFLDFIKHAKYKEKSQDLRLEPFFINPAPIYLYDKCKIIVPKKKTKKKTKQKKNKQTKKQTQS